MLKFLSFCLGITLLSTGVHADCGCTGSANSEKGGFVNDSLAVSSVAETKKMADETIVKLKGKIVKQINDEEYEFADASGKVVIEVDEDDWNGLKITSKNEILIIGEIDKETNGYKIEVEEVSFAK